MKALIFAAGLGTRLRPLTDTMPKALVPVNGKPLLQWQIEKLKKAGIDNIYINVHHKAEQIRHFLNENYNFGCHITLSDETDRLLDTGGGLRKVLQENDIDEPLLVLNVDILSNIKLAELSAAYKDELALLVVSSRHTSRYLLFDNNRMLRGWTNIQTGAVRPEGLVTAGLCQLAFSGMQIVSPKALYTLNQIEQDCFSVIDWYMHLLSSSKADECLLKGYVPNDYKMMDVGKIEQLSEVERWARSELV